MRWRPRDTLFTRLFGLVLAALLASHVVMTLLFTLFGPEHRPNDMPPANYQPGPGQPDPMRPPPGAAMPQQREPGPRPPAMTDRQRPFAPPAMQRPEQIGRAHV